MIIIRCPNCAHETKLYSTEEAADQLGLSLSAFKYHLYYGSKNIEKQLVGHTLMFTKIQLDEFLATKRGPGRPRKDKAML